MTVGGLVRGRLAARFLRVACLVGATFAGFQFGLGGEALAASCAPVVFTYGGYDWCTDRAETAYHNTVVFGGRSDVLNLGIKQFTPPVFNPADFYQTEGYKTVTNSPIGSTFVSGDIYIPAAWQAVNAA